MVFANANAMSDLSRTGSWDTWAARSKQPSCESLSNAGAVDATERKHEEQQKEQRASKAIEAEATDRTDLARQRVSEVEATMTHASQLSRR